MCVHVSAQLLVSKRLRFSWLCHALVLVVILFLRSSVVMAMNAASAAGPPQNPQLRRLARLPQDLPQEAPSYPQVGTASWFCASQAWTAFWIMAKRCWLAPRNLVRDIPGLVRKVTSTGGLRLLNPPPSHLKTWRQDKKSTSCRSMPSCPILAARPCPRVARVSRRKKWSASKVKLL